jgi:hypothetical protein
MSTTITIEVNACSCAPCCCPEGEPEDDCCDEACCVLATADETSSLDCC